MPVVGERADDRLGVVPGPVLEAGAGKAGRHVHVRVVDERRGGEDAYRADDRVADRDQRHDDRQSGGNPGQIQRQPGPAGHDQVPEHSFGEVTRSRRAAHRGRDDVTENGQEAGYQDYEDLVAAGGWIGARRERMGEQANEEKDRREPDVHQDESDHEAAPFAQLHDFGGDHAGGGDRRSAAVA